MVQVLIRSANKKSGTNNDAYYFIDWNRFLKPNTKYEVSFTYTSDGSNIANVSTVGKSLPALLYANFGQSSLDVQNNSNASSLYFCGLLKWRNLVSASPYTGFLDADKSTNNIFYINSLPNNEFNIKLYDNTLTLWKDTAGTPAQPANYMLILNFEEC